MLPSPLAPRASIYSDDIPHTYCGSDVLDVSNACDIPHAVSTPEIIETVVTHSGDVVEGFNFYGYMIIFIFVIMVISFLLDR